VNVIFSEVLSRIKPSGSELKEIKESLKIFLDKLEANRKRLKIDAQIFIGGSFAKNTLVKKDKYDIDVFVRFDKRYDDKNLSELTEKILRGFNSERIHGSRDYFKINVSENLFFEVVPVKKISTSREAVNITDLSYYHVKYVNKKIKNEKILDDIMLAKAFCEGARCYGAESYINGFSGYGLELLIYHYKRFMNFVKAMTKVKNKVVIDLEKHHKKTSQILMDLNSAKLESPIVMIDPTEKQRNVLAALSEETFSRFQNHCKSFLKDPTIDFFERQDLDMEFLKQEAKKKRQDFLVIEVKTNKQSGDVAGSKLLKFYKTIQREISRFFEVKKSEFEYLDEGQTAKYFFIVKSKKEILIVGPRIKNVKHVKRFKVKHKKTFVKNGRICVKLKVKENLAQFITNWKKKNQKIMSDMSIGGLTTHG